MQSFKLKFSGVTILQGVEFPIFLLMFEWALQQCSATALPVIVPELLPIEILHCGNGEFRVFLRKIVENITFFVRTAKRT